MIRELREEVEKLRMQLATSGGGVEGGGASPKELQALQDKLQWSEGLITDMTKSWEQKLAEANRMHLVGVVTVDVCVCVCVCVCVV